MSSYKQSVMMQHTLQELSDRNCMGKSQQKRPYVLALITSHLIGMEPGLLYLNRLVKKQWIVRISAEQSLFLNYTRTELIGLTGNDDWIPLQRLTERLIKQADIILIPILSFSLVSDIISFNEQRPIVRMILNGLLTGKKVVALKVGTDPYHEHWKLNGLDKGTNLLKRKLYKQLSELKSMGIIIIDPDERVESSLVNTEKKTIVTAETVRYIHLQKHDHLIVTKESIITPLAIDVARELNITLILE
ncbi:hypothetical protein [Bacillus sp. S/N-304-OC-R1]|uniref:hypothetical protein n=1 Tax=Bacillus sp. S/N-304-OC-R1 TaxID=2758034 RepID=UPI001C8F1A36|nr:hypothetical protein [Bacillus sp. S/N-304-OC-R1]MBY0120493.1 hypothetical protein [Bacillus sp. S/N-304-OC-R1]